MFRKAIEELRGGEVVARYGRIGAVDDVYYDGGCWQVRYLLLDAGGSQLVLSVACLAHASPPRGRMFVNLSRARMEAGAGAWPAAMLRGWLESERLCSGRETVGMRVLAQDGAFGRVSDLLVDDEHWSIESLIVDAPAGRPLVVPLGWVGPVDRRRRAVYLQRRRAQLLEAGPQLRILRVG
jgi:hypothetical protein